MTASNVVSRLERELTELWNASSDAPVARACTMNLVVVVGDEKLAERYTAVVDDVTRAVPARAIVVALVDEEAGKPPLDGEVTAVCSTESGEKVCSERVSLIARGGAVRRIVSAVEALLVPEMPTTLVWLGSFHRDDEVFEGLAELSQQVLIDSEYTELASIVELAAWAQDHGAAIADLAWTRLAPWQELVARFFDAEPSLAHGIHHVVLRQATDEPGLGTEAGLLLGWIGSRLGWKAERAGGRVKLVSSTGAAVRIEVTNVPRPAGVAPRALAGLSVDATEGGASLRGELHRDLASGLEGKTADADTVTWSLASEGVQREHRLRFGSNRAAKWLERTIHRPRKDAALFEAAALVAEISGEPWARGKTS